MSSCLFAATVIFDWVLDTINFTLLGAGYLCIPTNALRLYSGWRLCGQSDGFRCRCEDVLCSVRATRSLLVWLCELQVLLLLPYHMALSWPHIHVPITTTLTIPGDPLQASGTRSPCCNLDSGLCAAHLSCLGDPRLSALLPSSGSLLATADFLFL